MNKKTNQTNKKQFNLKEKQSKNRQQKKWKEGKIMAKRRVLSRGMDLGRHEEIGTRSIDADTGAKIEELGKLKELGEKLVSDKNKIEAEIDKIMNSKIKAEDKVALLRELREAVEKLQEQYDREVEEERERIQEETQENIEVINSAVEELQEKEDSLRNITMDAGTVDFRRKLEDFLELG